MSDDEDEHKHTVQIDQPNSQTLKEMMTNEDEEELKVQDDQTNSKTLNETSVDKES